MMNSLNFKSNILLKNYTTYGIGGYAKRFIEVNRIESLVEVMKLIDKEGDRFIIIGNGSNILFDDRGFDGVVVLNKINFIEWRENIVNVGSGYNFSLLGSQATKKGLSGLEFGVGIPGTVGGAVFMNAGANGLEIKDAVESICYIHKNGFIYDFSKENGQFGYRHSVFQQIDGAIASVKFSLKYDDSVKKRKIEMINYRKATQPYREKSCGCVFYNPKGYSAGKLIEECGLKGLKLGGAQVSTVHCNFIINIGNASSKEVLDLIKYIQFKVCDKSDVMLQTEVRYISYD